MIAINENCFFFRLFFHILAENEFLKEASLSPAGMMSKIIPLKHDMEEVDLDGEQTTASIKSVSTPAKNQMELDENMETMENMKDPTPKESTEGGGRVRRFLNDIKSNCKTADTVLESKQQQHNKHDNDFSR